MEQQNELNQLELKELSSQQRQQTFTAYVTEKYQDDLAILNPQQQQEFKQLKVKQLEQEFQKESDKIRQLEPNKSLNLTANSQPNQDNFDIDEDENNITNKLEEQLTTTANNWVNPFDSNNPYIQQQRYLKQLEQRRLQQEINRLRENKRIREEAKQARQEITNNFEQPQPQINKKESPNRGLELVDKSVSKETNDFRIWFYVKRASDDYQIGMGVKNPTDSTPSFVLWSQQVASVERKRKANNVALDIFKQNGLELDEDYYSLGDKIYQQLEDNSQQFTQARYEAWKSSQAGQKVEIELSELHKWREKAQDLGRSQGQLSKIEKLITDADKQGKTPNDLVKIDYQDYASRLDDLEQTETNNIYQVAKLEYKQKYQNSQTTTNLQELKAWRKEAEALGRSEKHLKKIARVTSSALKIKSGKSLKIGLKDKRAMEKDRTDFWLKQPTNNKTQSVAVKRR